MEKYNITIYRYYGITQKVLNKERRKKERIVRIYLVESAGIRKGQAF